MPKYIKEAGINTIDPSEYRSFLVFRAGMQEHATGINLNLMPAFMSSDTPAHAGPTEQLFIEVQDPQAPSAAARVRLALLERAKDLGRPIRS